MPSVLITGCDTGIGREFARQYLAHGWRVYATYLKLDNRLDEAGEPGALTHHLLDVTEPGQFEALRREIDDAPLDVLLSNAGVGLEKAKFGEVDFDYAQRMYRTNALGPLRLVQTFVDNVTASELRRIAVVSSRMGSIGSNLTGGHYGYRASKAALNAMMRSVAIDVSDRGISVITLHPGAVAVPSAPVAPVTAADSVSGMRHIIDRLGPHETGQFYRYDGTPVPW